MENCTMFGSYFPRDLFAELARLQRGLQPASAVSATIRGQARGGYPALNVGTTPETVEIHAYAPGLDPATLEVKLDRGTLSIAGERKPDLPSQDAEAAVHINERFAGSFRRVLTLPDDLDPNAVTATYRDGILTISIRRRVATQPRRIEIH